MDEKYAPLLAKSVASIEVSPVGPLETHRGCAVTSLNL